MQPLFPLLLTSIHKAVIMVQHLSNHKILECFLLLTPNHGPQEEHMVAFKDSPDSHIPTHGTRALICHSNQQSPTGLLNQWTALPDQGLGVPQPAMDRHWSFKSTPNMVSSTYHWWYQCIYQFSWRYFKGHDYVIILNYPKTDTVYTKWAVHLFLLQYCLIVQHE